MKTYNEIYLAARRRLRDEGIEAADLESRLMAAKASGKTRENFLVDSRFYVTDDSFEKAIDSMIERRIAGEPIAYITGEWEFYGLPVNVTKDVLIPRTDTEVLVDAAIKLLKRKGLDTRILDLCAGSGCIGLAVAANVPSCRTVLVDKYNAALSVCRSNILKNNMTRCATSVKADAKQLPPMLLGRFDLIVCNPPYIPSRDIMGLDLSVRDFEPTCALDGGDDGLDFFREIAKRWRVVLKDNGYLLFECGAGQAGSVRDIMMANGFEDINTYTDTLGIERVVSGKLTQRNGGY